MNTTTAQPAYFSTGEVWESGKGNRYRVAGVTESHARLEPMDNGGIYHWWPRNRVGRWVRLTAAGEG